MSSVIEWAATIAEQQKKQQEARLEQIKEKWLRFAVLFPALIQITAPPYVPLQFDRVAHACRMAYYYLPPVGVILSVIITERSSNYPVLAVLLGLAIFIIPTLGCAIPVTFLAKDIVRFWRIFNKLWMPPFLAVVGLGFIAILPRTALPVFAEFVAPMQPVVLPTIELLMCLLVAIAHQGDRVFGDPGRLAEEYLALTAIVSETSAASEQFGTSSPVKVRS
jgi:hypothetical protein